ATGGPETLQVWMGKAKHHLEGPFPNERLRATFSRDHSHVFASGRSENRLSWFRLDTTKTQWERQPRLTGHREYIHAGPTCQDKVRQRRLVTVSQDNTARLWTPDRGLALVTETLDVHPRGKAVPALVGKRGETRALRLAIGKKRVAVLDMNGRVFL